MGMIIRVAFNNQNWMGKCTNVFNDPRFNKCITGTVDVKARIDELGNCKGEHCVEKTLCTECYWENFQGNFGKRATGTVFFVFPDVDGSLVLWGRSKVKRVKGNRVHFEGFQPMPEERWVKGLCAKDILGVHWGQGTHRYLNKTQEDFLMSLIAKMGEE